MSASLTTGHTFGVTEQVTSTKLNNVVNDATISGILGTEIAANASIPDSALAKIVTAGKVGGTSITNLSSLASASGKIPPQNIWNLQDVATNASVPNIGTGTIFRLYKTTYGSIASFSNARVGQQFTVMAMQASFPAILDTGAFKLSAAWKPATARSSLTMIWDGSSFVEIARTTV